MLIAAIDPAIGSVAIESVVEPVHGKHDEGGSLSGCVRNCVEAVRQR